MTITKVILGKLSPTMEEGTIVRWAKNEGDAVKPGDVLAEIETDKANMEMEAMGAGVLRRILVPAGAKAPVGGLIGVIADPGDDIASLVAQATPAVAASSPVVEPAAVPTAAVSPAVAAPAPIAAATPVPIAVPVAPAPVAPVADRPSDGARVKASPLARSIAARQNIVLFGVHGSGPGGRIVRRDVLGLAAGVDPPSPVGAAATQAVSVRPTALDGAAAAVPAPVAPPAEQEVPVSSMRRVIAQRLSESKFTAPHFYVTVEIDMGPAMRLREELAEAKLSFNDLVIKACAKALLRFPMVNASWLGDRMALHGEVHVGVAVAVPDGLIVPVVRNADRKTVSEISLEVKDLASRARDRKLRPEEFTGSTFSISNLGMFGVTEFTAIINPPESAILAVGAVQKQPVVVGDQLVVGHRMKVTLSCDHRVVDGALAAQFLAEVRRLLEHPLLLWL